MAAALVERATSASLLLPDWSANMDLCDAARRGPDSASAVIAALRKRSAGAGNPKVSMLCICVLETLAKNANAAVLTAVCGSAAVSWLSNLALGEGEAVGADADVRRAAAGLLQHLAIAHGHDHAELSRALDAVRARGAPFPDVDVDVVEAFALCAATPAPEEPTAAGVRPTANEAQGGGRQGRASGTHGAAPAAMSAEEIASQWRAHVSRVRSECRRVRASVTELSRALLTGDRVRPGGEWFLDAVDFLAQVQQRLDTLVQGCVSGMVHSACADTHEEPRVAEELTNDALTLAEDVSRVLEVARPIAELSLEPAKARAYVHTPATALADLVDDSRGSMPAPAQAAPPSNPAAVSAPPLAPLMPAGDDLMALFSAPAPAPASVPSSMTSPIMSQPPAVAPAPSVHRSPLTQPSTHTHTHAPPTTDFNPFETAAPVPAPTFSAPTMPETSTVTPPSATAPPPTAVSAPPFDPFATPAPPPTAASTLPPIASATTTASVASLMADMDSILGK